MKAYWANAAGGSFFVAANWSDDHVPAPGDIASMTLPGTYEVTDSVSTTVLGIATGKDVAFGLTGGVIFAATEGTASGVNRDAVVLGNGTELKTGGTFDNAGVVDVNGTTAQTFLLFVLPAVLDGGGTVVLQNSTNAILAIDGASLTNVDNTIEGAGDIEGGGEFINEAKGTVEADRANASLTLTTPTQNAGLLEALDSGVLDIFGNVINTATGIIEAGAGGFVNLGNADIQGGTLDASLAVMEVVGTATLDGTGSHPVTIEGGVSVNDAEILTLAGTIDNKGEIGLQSAGNLTGIKIGLGTQGVVTLQGGGDINLNQPPVNTNFIESTNISALSTLNNVDNTISGSGVIEFLILNNEKSGTVSGNLSGGGIAFFNCITNNAGLLTASDGGQLTLAATTVVNSATGIVEANDTAAVQLESGAIITGGTVATSGSGEIEILFGGAEFASLATTGKVAIENGDSLTLSGTIGNTGTMSIGATTLQTALELTGATVTLIGNGTVALSNGNAMIESVPTAATPTELVNNGNTIAGGGVIDNVILNNEKGSLIDANITNGLTPLIVDTGLNTIVNAGTFQAEVGAELYINGPLNNSGAINALGAIVIAGTVTGKGTATIGTGGTLEFGAASAASVTFAGTSGELILDQSGGYTGTISGFADSTQSIDLADIDAATATPTFSGTTLTVTDGDGDVAKLKFGGKHTLASFHLANDGGGGTLITDPSVDSAALTVAAGATLELAGGATGKVTFAGPAGTLQIDTAWSFAGKVAGFGAEDRIDLADVAFGPQTTLGYAATGAAAGKLTVSDGIHTADIALLGRYMASSFVEATDGHGGTLITEASPAAQHPLLSHAHA